MGSELDYGSGEGERVAGYWTDPYEIYFFKLVFQVPVSTTLPLYNVWKVPEQRLRGSSCP